MSCDHASGRVRINGGELVTLFWFLLGYHVGDVPGAIVRDPVEPRAVTVPVHGHRVLHVVQQLHQRAEAELSVRDRISVEVLVVVREAARRTAAFGGEEKSAKRLLCLDIFLTAARHC